MEEETERSGRSYSLQMAPVQVSHLSHPLGNKGSKVHRPGLFCFSALKEFGTFLLKINIEEILTKYVKPRGRCQGDGWAFS